LGSDDTNANVQETNYSILMPYFPIGFYFLEAEREGVNPDLAIAQMIWNLQYFSENKRYKDLRQTHNYGAFDIPKNVKTAYWNGSHFTGNSITQQRRNGIQAHIQFLKRSADRSLNSDYTPLVLPKSIWNELEGIAGTRKTLEDISISWVGSVDATRYANDVKREYDKLLAYVSVRRR
jgi:hypothetical protein